ncbi:MAG: LytTR family DNA-binding domain-containing protein, partial [Gammaproteobacteria bacterium]|nr:LytTR family DNA-binding domain-containing protein [Gammaproteobacteria bacterium]
VQQHKPDLMLLDIQMPGLNGFDVIKALKPELIPHIVFVTAYDEYAIDAFDANAIDYVLKPISDERLARAIERVVEHLDSRVHSRPTLQAAVSEVAERVREKERLRAAPAEDMQAGEVRKLSIKDGDTVSIVNESDIDWIDAAGDYMCIHVNGVTHVMRSTLHELLGRLNEHHFKRVHRSTIVNIDRIMRVQKHTKGEYFLYLKGDEKIKVSRHYKGVIKEFIDQKQ